eukprot:3370506-Pyramimonas_sp.AAC.1
MIKSKYKVALGAACSMFDPGPGKLHAVVSPSSKGKGSIEKLVAAVDFKSRELTLVPFGVSIGAGPKAPASAVVLTD